jgi:DeoR family transcriptional regulator, fructose operon transcriptional repressor
MSSKVQVRHEALLNAIHAGTRDAETLSQVLGVSVMTIRRDLNQLASQGRLVRTYGGAAPAGGYEPELDLMQRKHLFKARKEAIARVAAAHILSGETIILDAGTTTATLALQLRGRRDLRVVTNSLQVWVALAGEPGIDLVILGGHVRSLSWATIGPLTEMTMRRLSADRAFLGADGIVANRGICEASSDQIQLKELMMWQAEQRYILVDSSKLGRAAQQAWAPLGQSCTLITDSEATDDQLAPFRKLPNLSIEVAG